jgi:hypothetical protein
MPESVTYVSGLNCYLCPRAVPKRLTTCRCCRRGYPIAEPIAGGRRR